MPTRSRLVLRSTFALGQVLQGLSATEERIKMVKEFLLLPLSRLVGFFGSQINGKINFSFFFQFVLEPVMILTNAWNWPKKLQNLPENLVINWNGSFCEEPIKWSRSTRPWVKSIACFWYTNYCTCGMLWELVWNILTLPYKLVSPFFKSNSWKN